MKANRPLNGPVRLFSLDGGEIGVILCMKTPDDILSGIPSTQILRNPIAMKGL